MNIDKFTKKREINKKIDSGIGTNASSIPSEIKSQRDEEQSATPVNIIVSDVSVLASETQSFVQSVIDEIAETNKNDSVFVEYHELVKKYHWNPVQLISSPTAKPTIKDQFIKVKLLEKNLYLNSSDPRSYFVQDLYRMKSESGMIDYILRSTWEKIAGATTLYTSMNENRLARLSLASHKQRLQDIQAQSKRIKEKKYKRLTEIFIRGFVTRVFNRFRNSADEEIINSINAMIKTIEGCKMLLRANLVMDSVNWEKFSDSILDTVGDYYALAINKMAQAQCYSLFSGIDKSILSFVSDMSESFLVDTIELLDIINSEELIDFKEQIENAIAKFLGIIEQDLMSNQKMEEELDDLRDIMSSNSDKSVQTREFIRVLDDFISQLNILKMSSLSSLNINEASNRIVTLLVK